MICLASYNDLVRNATNKSLMVVTCIKLEFIVFLYEINAVQLILEISCNDLLQSHIKIKMHIGQISYAPGEKGVI